MGIQISALWPPSRESFEEIGQFTPDAKPVGVFMLRLAVGNVYVVDGVLIDSGALWDFRNIRAAIESLNGDPLGRACGAVPIVCHAITHAHPDHQGSSRALCRQFGLPFMCGRGDCAVAEGKERMAVGPQYHPMHYLPHNLWSGRPQRVARVLQDGDKIGRTGAVTVVETPGHTPGSVSFWVPDTRVAIIGDVLANQPWVTLGGWSYPACPHEPPTRFTASRTTNRESLRKVMALGPKIVCFGHGPPLVLEDISLENVVPPVVQLKAANGLASTSVGLKRRESCGLNGEKSVHCRR